MSLRRVLTISVLLSNVSMICNHSFYFLYVQEISRLSLSHEAAFCLLPIVIVAPLLSLFDRLTPLGLGINMF